MREVARQVLGWVVVGVALMMAAAGLFFDQITGGLVYMADGAYLLCWDNGGSSADDSEALLVLGAAFFVVGVLRLALRRRYMTLVEIGLMPFVCMTGYVALDEIGCGREHMTIEVMGFPWLAFFGAGIWIYGLAVVALAFLRWPKLILP